MKTTILAAALLFSPLWANQPSAAPDFIADDEDYAEEAVQLDDGLFNILLEIESTMYSRQDESLFQSRLVLQLSKHVHEYLLYLYLLLSFLF